MDNIIVYDFKKALKFSNENIRFLTLICSEFCKTSTAYINYELKKQGVNITNNKNHQGNYEDFISNVHYESVILEFEMIPLVQNLVLSIDKNLAMTLIDLLLGGDGNIDITRELTNIDIEVLQHMMEVLLKKMHLPSGCEDVTIVNTYTSLSQYNKKNAGSSVFISQIDMDIDNRTAGTMLFCMPYSSMNKVLDHLVGNELTDSKVIELSDEIENNMLNNMSDVKMDISAVLGSCNVKVSDLLKIEDGDILILNQKVNEDIYATVGESKVYKCRAGLLGAHKGIIINDCIKRER